MSKRRRCGPMMSFITQLIYGYSHMVAVAKRRVAQEAEADSGFILTIRDKIILNTAIGITVSDPRYVPSLQAEMKFLVPLVYSQRGMALTA